MQGSTIYSDFSSEIAWIRLKVGRDVRSFSSSDKSLGRYYTEVRLKVLEGGRFRVTDPRMGRPIPYLAFWFADALGLTNKKLRRLSGLSLACSSIATTIEDDISDAGPENKSGKARLDRFWSREYLETLREIFPDEQGFKRVTSSADAEWRRYVEWQSNPYTAVHPRPFSADFLRESSRYYIACALPSLSAIAHAVGRKEEVPRISRFLREFSMGWKIFDDLMDWEKDLVVKQMNRSSVLVYFWNQMGKKKLLDKIDALSWFLNDEFVRDAYSAMVGFFLRAKRAVAGYGDSYVDRFLEEQISFQTEKLDSLLRSASMMRSYLNEGLASVFGPQWSRLGPRKIESRHRQT